MNTFYIRAIMTASLGGILYGYDMGVISGALPLLTEYFQLNHSQEEWVVSLLYFGGGLGAAFGGLICDCYGRRFAIILTDAMFGLGSILLYSAADVESVMFGRFIVGWAVAVSGLADVAYLHEISSVWGESCEEVDSIRIAEGVTETTDSKAAIGTTATSRREMRNEHEQGKGSRGSVVTVNEACISLGFLLAYAVAYALGDEYQNVADGRLPESWRMMFGFGGFLAVAQLTGMLCMPESPVWLHEKGRINEATIARGKIRGNCETIFHHRMIRNSSRQEQNGLEINRQQITGTETNDSTKSGNSLNREPPPLPEHHPPSSSPEEQPALGDLKVSPTCNSINSMTNCFLYLFIKIRSAPSRIHAQYQWLLREILAPYKKQCAIAFFLAVSQQFCGHTSVLNFSVEILTTLHGSVGKQDAPSFDFIVGIGVLKFLTTCIVILYIDKGSRRRWLLSGMSTILLSLTLLCIAFADLDIEHIGNSLESGHFGSFKKDLGILGIYGVAVGYAASYGPLGWLVTSELFPPSIRGRALGFATVITYMAAGLVSNTFLSLQQKVGLSGCFALYWTATIVSILIVWLGVPDTGGERTPSDIEREMSKLWIWGGRRSSLRSKVVGNGERYAATSMCASAASHSGCKANSNGHDPDFSSLDVGDIDIDSFSNMSSSVDQSGLTPRRSYSNNSKELT